MTNPESFDLYGSVLAKQFFEDCDVQHDLWSSGLGQPNLQLLLTPAALNDKYAELQSIVQEQILAIESSKSHKEVLDLNRIVGLLHEEAQRDVNISKQAKLKRLARKKDRAAAKTDNSQGNKHAAK